ncbi:MAG: hypothetical protein HC769_34755 [Cyanobacteria bacterium CRU_2_1]|nr:hypothetical protein [Cyanobacteria bacterium RU_5_0]NJR63489.1 hypothetical protein [Cyanobacteria bacterium CRU_2_1]
MGRYLTPLTLVEPQYLKSQTGFSTSQPSASSIWVRLAVLPNPYSHNQALLICPHSDDEWLAWIPDHGEVVLHLSEFYFDRDWN